MSLSARAILTFDEMRIALRIAADDADNKTLVEQLISQVSEAIEGATGKYFMSKAITAEVKNGTGQVQFWTDYTPIETLTKVYFYDGDRWDDVTGSTYGYTLNHKAATGEIYFDERYATFPEGENNIKISYTAGYSTVSDIPFGIKLACQRLVAIEFKRFNNNLSGEKSRNVGDASNAYDMDSWPPDVKQLLGIR